MLIISFNIYDLDRDRFVTTQMSFDFSVTGIITPAPIKIISFALDIIKQVDPTAIIVDVIQIMFCFSYVNRIIFLKIKEPRYRKRVEQEPRRI